MVTVSLASLLMLMSERADAHDKFELDLTAGYRFGSKMDVRRVDDEESEVSSGALRVNGSFAFSAIAGYRAQPNGFIYLSYSRQQTSAEYSAKGSSVGEFVEDASLEYYQFGGNVEMTRGRLVPYLGFSVGLGRLAALGGGSSRVYFAPVIDAGFKIDIIEHLHLRFLGRLPVLFATGDVFCPNNSGCTNSEKVEPLAQLELHGGLGVSF